jgi:hypothetical protein
LLELDASIQWQNLSGKTPDTMAVTLLWLTTLTTLADFGIAKHNLLEFDASIQCQTFSGKTPATETLTLLALHGLKKSLLLNYLNNIS